MPFTPSHAVVALPFLRTPLIPAAIAVGAMTPDLPLFVRGLPLTYGLTHDLGGLPATIVTALVLLLLWRCVLRPAVRELSPAWLAARLSAEWDAGAPAALRETLSITGTPPRTSWRGILLLLGSLLVGILSHIVWDLFTHEGRWGVQAFPLLEEYWGPLAGFKWLQHGSSVLGLVVLTLWGARWLTRRAPAPRAARLLHDAVRWSWWLSLPLILLGAWVVGMGIFGPFTAEWTVAHLAYRVLPPACALWAVVTVALAIAVQVRRKTFRQRSRVTATGPRHDPSDAAD